MLKRVLCIFATSASSLAAIAAHIHSLAGGEGMNTGIQDMINLCWKLAFGYKGISPATSLDSYEAERLPVIRARVATTEGATDAFTADSRLMHAMISHVPIALHTGVVHKRAAKVLSQTGTSYSGDPLTRPEGNLGETHPCERVPPRSGKPPLNPNCFTVMAKRGIRSFTS